MSRADVYGINNARSSGAYALPSRGSKAPQTKFGSTLLSIMVWIATALMLAILVAIGQPLVAVGVFVVVLVGHSLFQPRVAIYVLVAIIPLDWAVSVIPRVTTLSKVIGLIALLVTLPRLIQKAASFKWDPSVKWMVIMFIWATFGCFWAPLLWYAGLALQQAILAWGMALLICLHLTSRSFLQMAMVVLVVSCFVSSLLILKSNDPHKATQQQDKRVQAKALVGGEGANLKMKANYPSRQAAIGVFTCIYFLLATRGMVKRVMLLMAIIVMCIAIILMKGRMVYLALPAAFVGAVVLLKGGGLLKRVLIVLVVTIVGGLTTFVAIKLGVFGEGIANRFSSISEEGMMAGKRGELWAAYFNEFINSRLVGGGYRVMHFRAESYYGHAHNDWFQIMGELGIIGLVCFFAFHLNVFRRILRIDRIWDKMWALSVWLFIILAALTETDQNHKYYTLTLALVLSMVRLSESEHAKAKYAQPALLTHRAYARY